MNAVVAAGTGSTPAAFFLGLCRSRGILSLPAPHDCAAGGPLFDAAAMTLQRFPSLALKSRIDAAFGLFLRVSLHRFPSLALKSRIDARKRLFPRVSLHRFPSLALKSRIDAAVWLFLRVFLQRFQSLPLEIRNRCSSGVVAFCRRNHSSLRQQKTESDADLVAATAAAGETVLLCGDEE